MDTRYWAMLACIPPWGLILVPLGWLVAVVGAAIQIIGLVVLVYELYLK